MNPETPIQPPKPTFKERLLGIWNKFYSNKKIFWLITSLFSLIILISISGLIFRLVRSNQKTTIQTSTPTPMAQTQTEEKKEPLDLAKEELTKLDGQIKNLDIKQQKLMPPAVDFKVDF